jgi:hypothetical protein
MRRITLLIVTGTLGFGLMANAASAESPPSPPQSCPGELVSFAVQSFGGRRAVADTFFGDYPHAVQDAQAFLEQFCGVTPA